METAKSNISDEVDSQSKRKSNLLLYIFGLAMLGISLTYAIAPPKQNTANGVFASLKEWLSYSYDPIQQETLPGLVDKIPIQRGKDIDENLVLAAKRSTADFISAFSAGSYESYTRFRFPQEAELVRSNYLAYKSAMSSTNTGPVMLAFPPAWAVDPKYLLQMTNKWPPIVTVPKNFPAQELNETNFTEVVVRTLSQGTWYKGYFENLACTNSYIKITRVSARPPPLNKLMETERMPSGAFRGKSFYKFKTTPEEILKRDKHLTIVVCKLMIKLKAPDTVAPQFVQFYYDPLDGKFIPFEMSTGNGMAATFICTWF